MKKNLLIATLLIAAIGLNAADKVWDFSVIFTKDETSAYISETPLVVPLVADELYGLSTKFAIDNTGSTSMKKWTTGSYHTRLKTGGSGDAKEANSVAIKVAGNSVIQVCAVSSSSSDVRKLVVATASGDIVGSFLVDGNAGKDAEVEPPTFNYTGGETVLYIFSAKNTEAGAEADGYKAGGINFYMISATNSTKITEADLDTQASTKSTFSENGLSVNTMEIVNTQGLNIEIYNALGKLVTKSSTHIAMAELTKGVYIVRAEGVKGAMKFMK